MDPTVDPKISELGRHFGFIQAEEGFSALTGNDDPTEALTSFQTDNLAEATGYTVDQVGGSFNGLSGQGLDGNSDLRTCLLPYQQTELDQSNPPPVGNEVAKIATCETEYDLRMKILDKDMTILDKDMAIAQLKQQIHQYEVFI